MAEAVVSLVLEKLSDFMIKEVTFLSEVGDRVELAQTELQLMRGYLKDADARQGDEERIRLWVASVRDAAYDFEDVIDTYFVKVIFKRKGDMTFLKRFAGIFKEGFHLHMIGSELQKITTKISKLNSSLQSYNIKELQGGGGATASFESQQDQRRVYPHVKEREVVGLDGDAETLASYLVREEKRHLVVSIWGMGGSGKTTLAKHVYDRQNDVKQYFECFAWVYVSQQCQGREVLEEILIQLISSTNEQRTEIANMKMDHIAKILYSLQIKYRCLVVLDDIWNIDAWETLKAGFPTNEETGSRILLTSRNKEVALHVNGNCFLHQSRLLNANASWELFAKIAIFRTAEPNCETYARKEELGKRMLQHCAGLPLAIIVLAELLARKKTTEEWYAVHKNVDVYIRRGTNLEREYKGQEYKGASWVLALSYDNLPYRLKLCFLYLGHFPEDSEIPVKRLTQLWMAECLISPTSEEMMEDVAYNCLSELVERCMVQVGRYGSTNKIKTCRLHDLMRDLCVLKAKEENFLHIVNFSSIVNKAPIGKIRRLAIYLNREVGKSAPIIDGRHVHLRSLLYFGEPNLDEKLIQPTFKYFKFLRVLKFEDMVGQVKLSIEIGNLVHLRFLSLKNSNIEELPSSVSNLVGLQTLDLRCCSVWETVPNVFGKLEQLRHLYLPSEHKTSEKLSFGAVCRLQTLVNVSWGQCDLAELTNLRKLFIEVSETSQNTAEILKSTSITSLSVKSYGTDILGKIVSSCHDLIKLRVVGPIRDVLEELPNYPNLRKLTLEITRLTWSRITVLEKLPELRTLYLTNAFRSGYFNLLIFSKGGFPHLEFLSLKWLYQLKDWKVEKGAMPSLCRLHIERCYSLTTLPAGLQYVTTLNELAIKDMPSTFCNRLQQGGEDFYKVQHVASVTLDSASHEFVRLQRGELRYDRYPEEIQVTLRIQDFKKEDVDPDGTDPIDEFRSHGAR